MYDVSELRKTITTSTKGFPRSTRQRETTCWHRQHSTGTRVSHFLKAPLEQTLPLDGRSLE